MVSQYREPIARNASTAALSSTRCAVAPRASPGAIYNLHRRLITLGRRLPSLLTGRYRPVTANGDLLLFVREHESERTLVGLKSGRRRHRGTVSRRPAAGGNPRVEHR